MSVQFEKCKKATEHPNLLLYEFADLELTPIVWVILLGFVMLGKCLREINSTLETMRSRM